MQRSAKVALLIFLALADLFIIDHRLSRNRVLLGRPGAKVDQLAPLSTERPPRRGF